MKKEIESEAKVKDFYPMTNDYMFRAVLQKSQTALKGLIGAMLHIDADSITSLVINDTSMPGNAITEKEYRLDILVTINNFKVVNLEMQVENELNWSNRSLLYLCRKFDRVNKGEDYDDIMPVIHIGFLNFTLFRQHPEFNSTYMMTNIKDGFVYNDGFAIYVVELNNINLATPEDKLYNIDEWARLFKASREEVKKMMLSEDKGIHEAAVTLNTLNEDEMFKEKCRDREEYLKSIRTYKKVNNRLMDDINKLTEDNSRLTEDNTKLTEDITKLTEDNTKLAEDNTKLAEDNTNLTEKISQLMQIIKSNNIKF
ncbi:MAG: Rpn family recombination-promoting nuclease/putative transposase [Butyrivibrio sp.]|nr:Rpn family recombination-promoting nuclease/putative transposase [Butyrivibrio sp.]